MLRLLVTISTNSSGGWAGVVGVALAGAPASAEIAISSAGNLIGDLLRGRLERSLRAPRRRATAPRALHAIDLAGAAVRPQIPAAGSTPRPSRSGAVPTECHRTPRSRRTPPLPRPEGAARRADRDSDRRRPD